MTEPAAPALIAPGGCQHCGLPRHGHCQRWTRAAGWHGYTAPTDEQIKARMLARRAARVTTLERSPQWATQRSHS